MSVEIYPVVHINDPTEAVTQAQLALDSGADGIYLIDHLDGDPGVLFDVYSEVATNNPDSYVGVNMLGHPVAALALREIGQAHFRGVLPRLPSGLWVDNAKLYPELLDTMYQIDPTLRSIRLLGGAAFKYTQHYTENPRKAAREAVSVMPYVDVVTTSGKGTGHAPNPKKIQAMKKAIGDKSLAIASGITADNLHEYDGHFDQLLVSTGVEVEPYSGIFDPVKLQELVDLAHESQEDKVEEKKLSRE